MTGDDPGHLSAAMVADYMDQGLLENIILMFQHDPTLYPMAAELLQDERIRVRMGAVALVESLAELDPGGVSAIATAIAPLLTDASATIRGDAAYAVGLTGTTAHLVAVRRLLADPFADVREIAADAVAAIEGRD